MPLYVKDREVGELAERLASLKKVGKTEAVRQALSNEMARVSPFAEKLAQLRAIQEELRAKSGPGGQPVTKEWIDSLYEDD